MNILLCCDNNFVGQASVLIHSIQLTNNKSTINFYILTEDISDINKQKISNIIEKKNSIFFLNNVISEEHHKILQSTIKKVKDITS